VRIGVIGAGVIGHAVNIPAVRRLGGQFGLITVADPSDKVRAGLAGRYPNSASTPTGACCWRRRRSTQSVCSPHATHPGIAVVTFGEGLHVLVEKSLAIRLDDIDAKVALTITPGVVPKRAVNLRTS
jgi:predicted dehydrogenase